MAMGQTEIHDYEASRDTVIFLTVLDAPWVTSTQEMCYGQYEDIRDALASHGYISGFGGASDLSGV